MGTAVIDLGRYRAARQTSRAVAEMRVALAVRTLAGRLVAAYRAAGRVPPETLRDAARRLENSHHRGLGPKIVREVTDAIASGVPAREVAAALHATADQIAAMGAAGSRGWAA